MVAMVTGESVISLSYKNVIISSYLKVIHWYTFETDLKKNYTVKSVFEYMYIAL